MTTDDTTVRAARAVERLRLAEARLSRRRQTECGPSETARAATRYIFEQADAGGGVTPTEIADHIGVSTATMTGILKRLHAGGIIAYERNPDDGRSKRVRPLDRSTDLEDIDPLTAKIRAFAAGLSEREAEHVARFLDAVSDEVDKACE